MKTGFADLPLHPGKCPPWLFGRMRKLAGAVSELVIHEYGQEEYLRRLADPFFFQSFGCLVGFDWHSSGLTTTLCGALKESVALETHGVAVLGGKGKASRKTPQEIMEAAEQLSFSTAKTEELIYASRMAAKVDNSLVQDDYNLYHHTFILSEKGGWAVLQQGMNDFNGYARRYHWLSESVSSFIIEPHVAVCCDRTGMVINMVARESDGARGASIDLVRDNPRRLRKYFEDPRQLTLFDDGSGFRMTRRHGINLGLRQYARLMDLYEFQPRGYEEIVAFPGVGPKTIRSLALLSELVYGEPPSWRDPAKYSFAHGGKDGFPYPVDKPIYDKTIGILEDAVRNAKLEGREKLDAIRRLRSYAGA